MYLLRTELIFYHATINPLPKEQNSGLLVVPRIAKSTKGGRTCSYLTPKLWTLVVPRIAKSTKGGRTCSYLTLNSGLLVEPRIAKSTKGGRTCSYLTPKLWTLGSTSDSKVH